MPSPTLIELPVSDDFTVAIIGTLTEIRSAYEECAFLLLEYELEPMIDALLMAYARVNGFSFAEKGAAQQPTDTVPPKNPA